MKKSPFDALIGLIHESYAERIFGDGIAKPAEHELVFLIQSDVGPLGFELTFFRNSEGWNVMMIALSPLYVTGDNSYDCYDLCKIDLSQYELLNQLHKRLEWGSLFLSDEDGSKYPVFGRTEVLDPKLSFAEQDLSRLLVAIEMVELDAISAVPILAAMSSGIVLKPDAVELSLRDVKERLQ